jgi:hypothetical protein
LYDNYCPSKRIKSSRHVSYGRHLSVFKDDVSDLSKAMTVGSISKFAGRTPQVSRRPTSSMATKKPPEWKARLYTIVSHSVICCSSLRQNCKIKIVSSTFSFRRGPPTPRENVLGQHHKYNWVVQREMKKWRKSS